MRQDRKIKGIEAFAEQSSKEEFDAIIIASFS